MSVQQFSQDENTRTEVFAYIKDFADKYALGEMYKGADVSGIKNAVEIIKGAEKKMIAEFAVKKEKKVISQGY